tara:strand:- start:505 stop:927 length:423 start_codon:yes stop_codon:yes gene_type:complete
MHYFHNNLVSILVKTLIYILGLFFIIVFIIPVNQSSALSQEWVRVPMSEYGQQFWDKKSIKRNKDASIRVISKFIPKNKSQITQDILYTMDINCFDKSFRDVAVGTDQSNNSFNNNAVWEDPNGDKLILGVISQVCEYVD